MTNIQDPITPYTLDQEGEVAAEMTGGLYRVMASIAFYTVLVLLDDDMLLCLFIYVLLMLLLLLAPCYVFVSQWLSSWGWG